MTTSSINQTDSSTPNWYYHLSSYDALEIAPTTEYRDEFGTYCERTKNPAEAQFWSVYGHLPQGHIEYLDDFTTKEEAHGFASDLLNICSNLRIKAVSY